MKGGGYMGKFFQTENAQNNSAVEIVKDTLEVSDNGDVSFRTRRGRGSGKGVEITNDEFDQFVNLMNEVARGRNSTNTTTEDNTVSSSDSPEED